MPTLSKVEYMDMGGPTDAQRLSLNIPPVTARPLRQSTSKANTTYVKNNHTVTYSTMKDIPRIVTDVPVAWKGGFSGGSAIGSHDYDSLATSSPHQNGLGYSEPGETDAVVSVRDLGFSAAPWSTHHSLSCRPSQSDVFDHVSSKGQTVKQIQSAAEIEEEIRHKIESNLCWSQKDKEEYLPLGSFDMIFDIETIVSLIRAMYQTASEDEIIHKAGQIWCDGTGSRRRIFATLVFMKQTSHIEDFILEKIFDHHLPLCHDTKSMKGFRTLVGDDRVNTTLFQDWERVHVDLFYIYQRMIFVPFLSMGNGRLCSYVFDGNVRLPWDKFEQKTMGGHGTIHRLEIHQSHHDYKGDDTTGRPPCFAVKEINGADHESYRKELRALEQSCAKVQKEKHLIKLLLTFQHGNKPYLVFEWADGNLEEFWKTRQVEKSPSATKWMAQQCRGIANAIKRIHGLATWQKEERPPNPNSEEASVKDWGRHGDIKPTNILWFLTHGKDRDHLVVADLGLTRYHSSLTKSRVMRVDGYTGTYRAPEIDLGNPISSKYDIWSLGCVFLEFCIWYLLGYEDVENFQRDRKLDRCSDDVDDIEEPDHSYFVTSYMPHGGKRADLHPAVKKWVTRLRSSASCTNFISQMLDLIMNRMLVIDPKQRYSIDIISSELSRIEPWEQKIFGGLAHFPGTTNKTYQPPEPKSFKDHLQMARSPAGMVRFAEGNCTIPDSVKSSIIRKDQALEIPFSDADSEDGSLNGESTAATSVYDEELDAGGLRQGATLSQFRFNHRYNVPFLEQ
ncbi:protein kinase domain-containing protein [Colletotrichum orchidophilum]|uniref:Protein kinase domain-containing protein n=1 Tax=Colletotrichum orchidophilum TaxID=1209926 RepID=A0A1G4BRM4_9PEZI|nr:protein kinase domain-containing protein [Colletotrichum orchidophilum]OHF04102.1 protein kinase domain-containing protein [Colletotrichum orchidophilum]